MHGKHSTRTAITHSGVMVLQATGMPLNGRVDTETATIPASGVTTRQEIGTPQDRVRTGTKTIPASGAMFPQEIGIPPDGRETTRTAKITTDTNPAIQAPGNGRLDTGTAIKQTRAEIHIAIIITITIPAIQMKAHPVIRPNQWW